jgi:hypothetical protein
VRGYGWRCDQCCVTDIQVDDRSYTQQPPQGWYAVYHDIGVPVADGVRHDREWHFCSIQCLDIWSLKRAQAALAT